MTPASAQLRTILQWIATYVDGFNKIPAYHAEADRHLEQCRRVASGRTDPQTPLMERKTD